MPWFLLILPLLSAVVITFLIRSRGSLSAFVSVASVLATFVISLLLKSQASVDPVSFTWVAVGDFELTLGLLFDDLSLGMMLIVTSIGSLVHLFSLAYMGKDDGKGRYFGGLSLFMFSMTGIVLADNFVMMFIFWELVGVSSYILIGHWFTRNAAAEAAKKAFLTNRVGDFGFMIGILLMWGLTGTVVFGEMEGQAASALSSNPSLFGIAVLCLFCGAVGKSAQLPLHVWLPDAMEGPTPVSALIHAATMVAAGVYMLARVQFLISITEAAALIAWIGALTSLFAAVVATQQRDIKRILAYSTLSQLGYMVMAVGIRTSAPGGELMANSGVAMFHLYTHAFFKALLFLGAGAVIYACHHEQDIWKMGGLFKKMRVTFLTFAIGTAALAAVPYITSGFYSKEFILQTAYDGNRTLFYIAAVVAFLTPFYMMRLLTVAFLGKPRGADAEKAKEAPLTMLVPLLVLAVMAIIAGFEPVAEVVLGNVYPEGHPSSLVLWTSVGTLVAGAVLGFTLYRGKTKEPFTIQAVADKFYLDELYLKLIRIFQDGVAVMVKSIDQLLINGLGVRGSSRLANGFSYVFRHIQVGNLQAYAFLFGFGVIVVIYLLVFASRVS